MNLVSSYQKISDWAPKQSVIWLGHVLNFESARIKLTDVRVSNIVDDSLSIISKSSDGLLRCKVRRLASVVGSIQSASKVVGNLLN